MISKRHHDWAYPKEEYNRIESWFHASINAECERLIENGIKPSKLFLKYQFKDILMSYMPHYGELEAIHDPNMDCLLKVE